MTMANLKLTTIVSVDAARCDAHIPLKTMTWEACIVSVHQCWVTVILIFILYICTLLALSD